MELIVNVNWGKGYLGSNVLICPQLSIWSSAIYCPSSNLGWTIGGGILVNLIISLFYYNYIWVQILIKLFPLYCTSHMSNFFSLSSIWTIYLHKLKILRLEHAPTHTYIRVRKSIEGIKCIIIGGVLMEFWGRQ